MNERILPGITFLTSSVQINSGVSIQTIEDRLCEHERIRLVGFSVLYASSDRKETQGLAPFPGRDAEQAAPASCISGA